MRAGMPYWWPANDDHEGGPRAAGVTVSGGSARTCVLIDWPRAAIEYLEAAARVTEVDLRRPCRLSGREAAILH
jgi:hypothetical protein